MPTHSLTDKPTNAIDEGMMAKAIALAKKGEGRVEPNPMVGCVIAVKQRVIGEGYHRRFGGPHAEIEALRACSTSPGNATAYVSLEPCCLHGKTPPCVDALIEAGIARVVIAARDPNLSGGGVRRLRAAGITVQTGVLEQEATELLAPFLTSIQLRRPYVIAKWAQSLDGKLATQTGDSRWISGEKSRRRVHHLRARVDAILVGSGTVLADDPLLTARDVPLHRRALRVVLDGRLRIPPGCQLVVTAAKLPTLVLTTRTKTTTRKAETLRRRSVEVVACRVRGGRLDPASCLKELTRRGTTNLLVEGGPTILTSMLRAGLVDEALVFTAPILIGGSGAPAVLDIGGFKKIKTALKPRLMKTQRCGNDTLHRLRFT